MNNYIGKIDAEWVDPAVELPPDNLVCLATDMVGRMWISGGPDRRLQPGDRWLRLGGPSSEPETERMRLAACSVAALANTRESAKAARDVPDEYKSASWHDVCAAVDREMDLRDRIGGPTDAIPLAKVQAAVDGIAFEARGDQNTARHDRDQSRYYYARFDGRQNDLALIAHHTGVTPSEVQP